MNSSIRLQEGEFSICTENKVLKADDYQVYKNSDDLIKGAKEEAALIVGQAKEKAAVIKAEAKEAYESSKHQGYQDGLNKANAEIAEHIRETVGRTIAYIGETEKKMANIVLIALRKILGEFDDEQLTIAVVHQGLNALRGQQKATLRIAPDMVEAVEQDLQQAGSQQIPHFNVIPDKQIDPGRCVLESNIGVVECSIADQIEAIKSFVAKRLHGAKRE